MTFWIIAAFLTALCAAVLAFGLMRRRGGDAAGARDMQVYRDQLREVDRDLERGVITPAEAERVRLEVSRRLLAAKHKAEDLPSAAGAGPSPVLAGLVAVLIFAGAFVLYRQLGAPGYPDMPIADRLAVAERLHQNRMSQAEAEARAPKREQPPGVTQRHLELMDKLRAAMVKRPDDLEGQQLLADNEARLGNFAAARKAQQRVIEIKGDQANAADFVNLADLMALAADGYISPEAEAALQRALAVDPRNGGARYYMGLMYAQIGRPDLAFEMWRTLLDESLPQAPWVPPIRDQIELVARDAGITYRLPPEPAPNAGGDAPVAGLPGPSAADVAAAQEMSAQDRNAMIRSMVDRLSTRLASDGGTAKEWARLIGALGVLGETDRAAKAWADAQQVFAGTPADLDVVRAAAENAGVAR